MVTLSPELIKRLEERVGRLRSTYGHNNCKELTVKYYAEKLLTKNLNKIDHEENFKRGKGNDGMDWTLFVRKNFDFIYVRDNGLCAYCKCSLSKKEATMDHVLPISRGGHSTLENVTISCKWCNQDKGVLTADEYVYKQMVNAANEIYPPNVARYKTTTSH